MGQAEAPEEQEAAEGPLTQIYVRYASSLRKRCLRLTGDTTAAEDLMQEVFARFLARSGELPASTNVHGYLLATAHNVWLNQLRNERHVVVSGIDESLASDDRIEHDPVRALLLAEQRADVQRGAAGLTERQRRALALRELEDRSYGEIGAELGLGTNAVAQVIWRARTQLRRSLRRLQIDSDVLRDDCRARLDAMSDLVDAHSSNETAALEAHMADCRDCRRTLAAYREAGWRLRGVAPVLPLVAIVARVGTVLRAGVELPAGIGTAAAVTAAVVATAGGGGALIEHYAGSSRARPAAVHTLVRHVSSRSQIVRVVPSSRVIRHSAAPHRGSGRSPVPPVELARRSRITRPRSPVRSATPTAVPVSVAIAAPAPGPPAVIPRATPVSPPPVTVASHPATPPARIERTKEPKVPPGHAKTPPGQAKKAKIATDATPVVATTVAPKTHGHAYGHEKHASPAGDAAVTPAPQAPQPTTAESAGPGEPATASSAKKGDPHSKKTGGAAPPAAPAPAASATTDAATGDPSSVPPPALPETTPDDTPGNGKGHSPK